jgi:hypothetical protein
VAAAVPVRVCEGVPVPVRVPVAVAETERVGLTVLVLVLVALTLLVADGEGDADTEAVSEVVADTDAVCEAVVEAELELVDDVVTNGHAAYSLRGHTLVEIPHDAPSPWEKVPRHKLATVDNDLAIRIAAELRQSNPEGTFVLYLNMRNRLTAVDQVPARYVDGATPGLQQLIEAGVAREGAVAVILAARSMEPETVKLLQRGLQPTTNLLDVVTEREGSFLEKGLIRGTSVQVSVAASTLQEPASPYGDFEPSAPVIAQAAGAGRGKGSPYAKVNAQPRDTLLTRATLYLGELVGRFKWAS